MSNSNRDNNNKYNSNSNNNRPRRSDGNKIHLSPQSSSKQNSYEQLNNSQTPPKVFLTSPSKVLSKNENQKEFNLKETKLFSSNNNSSSNITNSKDVNSKIQPTMTASNLNSSGNNISNSGSSGSIQTESIKIINKTLKLNKTGIESLQKVLKDNDNFMVVGAIGAQSSGKSSILSALAGKNNEVPFEIQSENNFCLGNHQTDGIDIYIDSRDRIIYVDSQPLDSISILCELIDKSVHIPNNIVSYEHYHHLQSLKIVIFLMSICNVLLIVQENQSLDLSICKIIRTSIMLKNKLPDISQPNLNPSQLTNTLLETDQFEYKSKLMCIFNKLNELDYDMKPLDKTMAYLFTNPKDNYQIHPSSQNINLLTNIECFQIPEKKFSSSSNVTILQNTGTTTSIPTLTSTSSTSINSSSSSNSNISPIASQAISNLQLLNSIPILSPNKYYPIFNESIEKLKHQIILMKSTSKFIKSIKETEWLDNSIKIWDAIQNSDIIESYSKQIKSIFSIGLPKQQ